MSLKFELCVTNERPLFDPLITGRTESQRGHNLDTVWVLLAVAVRLVLDTEYSGLIGDNILLPFTLGLASLYMLGYVAPTGSTVSSLLSAGVCRQN